MRGRAKGLTVGRKNWLSVVDAGASPPYESARRGAADGRSITERKRGGPPSSLEEQAKILAVYAAPFSAESIGRPRDLQRGLLCRHRLGGKPNGSLLCARCDAGQPISMTGRTGVSAPERDMLEALASTHADRLSPWETDFVEDNQDAETLTARQRAKLCEIWGRVHRGGYR